jgi:TolA-binding protein
MLKRSIFVFAFLFAFAVTAFPQVENPPASGGVNSIGNNQVDSDLKFGLELFKNKMYDLAEEQFNKFLQQYPTSPSASQARYYLAMSQLNQNKFAAAAANFQNFAVQYPNDPLAATAWMNAADSYVKTNDFASAALAYERLQVFYPKDARAANSLIKAAKYFELSGDTSRAEISLMTIERDYPTSRSYFTATLQLGNLYFNSGQETKAEDQFKALLSSDDDSVRVMGLLALGRLDRIRGMSVQAGKYLGDAIRLNIDPQSTDALLESIQLELDAGNFSPAFQRADQIDVSGLSAAQKDKLTFEKAYAAIAVGDDATFRTIASSLKTLPPEYKIHLADLLEVKKRYSDGLSVLKNFPNKLATVEVLDLYAELAYRARRMKLADSLLALSVERSKTPDVRGVVKLLSIEAKSLKDMELARRTFYQYQNILKDRQDAFLYYTACFDENNDNYEEATANYHNLLMLYPESDYAAAADSALNYISTFKNVNYKNAVAGLADIVSEQAISPNGTTLLQLGNLFENDLKEYSKAEKVFRQLIAVSSGDTQRVAQYQLANVLERMSTGKKNENSESYSLYEKLALSPVNDSITGNSSLKMIEFQMAAGDSTGAGNSALSFLKRFPNSMHVPEVNCILAETMYSDANYNEAIVQAELVQSDPSETGTFAKAQLVIARSQIAIDSLDEAKATLENLFNSSPPKKYLLAGQLIYIDLLKKMKLDAGDAYSSILGELEPSNYKERIKSWLADYLYSMGKYDTAYSIYKSFGEDELWATPPSSVLYKMAYCKLRLGDLRAAKDIFSEVVTNSANLTEIADSYSQLGKIYESLGDKRMSAAFFEKAGSGDLNSLLNAAETYFRIGDYQDAIQVYKKIQDAAPVDTLRVFVAARLIEIDYKTDNIKSADATAAKFKKNYPGNDDEYLAQFLVDKAEYLMRDKQFKEAQRVLDDVKSDYRRTSAYPSSMLDAAQLFVEAGELEKAQDKLNELVNNFPNSSVIPMARFEIGNIYFAQEKYQDAINSFRSIYQDSLVSGEVLHDVMGRLVSAYESAGQYDGALDIARKFVAKYPDDPSIMDMKIKVGVLYEELRYFDQALLTFQNLAKEANRDYQAELHYYIGAIYNDKGDYSDAILEFLKVPYLVSKNAVVDWAAQAYYMAGKCYEQMNKPNEAIAMYQKIVDKPNTDKNFVDGAEREINRVKALLK